MSRPTEYTNLIASRALEEVARTPGAMEGFLRNAGDYLAIAKSVSESRPLQVFTLAYEGYFQVVQAVLEFHAVRTKEAGRNLAIQRVSSDLKVATGEFAFITKAHARRNGTSYTSPFPAVSVAEAKAMVAILEKYLPIAHVLTGIVQDKN